MGPHSRPAEFNFSCGRAAVRADPVRRDGRTARRRLPRGALSAGRAPRPVRRRSEVSGKGSVAGPRGRVACYSPRVRRPAGEPRSRSRRFRLPSGKARAPASARRVEGGLFHSVLRLPGESAAGSLAPVQEAQGPWRIDRHPIRPVLKHGPRSLTCARVVGLYETRQGTMKVKGVLGAPGAGSVVCSAGGGALPARLGRRVDEAERERTRWDPKDGELCLSRMKSGETLMEVRSDSDVQIDRRTRV